MKLKSVITREQGKTGAMGLATHDSVQVIDVSTRFMRVNGDWNPDLHIYKDEMQYTYYIWVKKKWKPFHNQPTFLQPFPKKLFKIYSAEYGGLFMVPISDFRSLEKQEK